MANEKIFNMSFSKVYGLLIAKVERKGINPKNAIEITKWLTGYSENQIVQMTNSDIKYIEFFEKAPNFMRVNNSALGKICGVKIREIDDPIMKKIRILDKLIDDVSKGKDIEKIIEKYKKL